MKSLFFLFFGTVFHRGLAEFYCVFSRCERLNLDQFPGRDLIVLCAFCVVLGSAVSPRQPGFSSDAVPLGNFSETEHRDGIKIQNLSFHSSE